jgi:hypothetical protein
VQLTLWEAGSLILQLTTPLGCAAPLTPVMIALKVVVPLMEGLFEALTLIVGVCSARVKVRALLESAL